MSPFTFLDKSRVQTLWLLQIPVLCTRLMRAKPPSRDTSATLTLTGPRLPIPLPFPLAMESSSELELRLRFLQLQIHQDLRDNGLSSETHVIPYMCFVVRNPTKPSDRDDLLRMSNMRSSTFFARIYPPSGIFSMSSGELVTIKPRDQVYYLQQIRAVSQLAFLAWRYSLPQVAGCLFPETEWTPPGCPRWAILWDSRGDDKAGTLGGYVTWSQDGKTIKCALTNYHVVRYRVELMGPSGKAFLDQSGASPTSRPGVNITVKTFADVDRQTSLAQANNTVKGLRHQLSITQENIIKRESSGMDPLLHHLDILKNNQQTFERLGQKRSILEAMPKKIGDVIATSGKAVLGKWLMDWALIRLDEETEQYFSTNKMFSIPWIQYPVDYGVVAHPMQPGFPITEFGSLKEGNWYTKLGRTSSVTTGHKGEALREQTCFADNGDSGSFVLDHDACVCGLLYGGMPSFFDRNRYFANAGLVMNIPDLTESMKLETMARDGNGQVCSAGVLGHSDYERG
ncbi:uncharacterized protein ASPGLDRAFT_22120 [Aspergillus glaucus CBS 516.65]|uniref:Uncharacterized protein n=1 Tax=Aspergillus glaucus CBS 516.65 TaxID=1160497 RepID=A0A1L9VXH9_ASPGL|nr:hypothetical protein ASPGLDRAFT_22120 [Aspergillus glaucus CBS 516.65]OJJ88620.1 hypothetical protein ASPGLDRAFT_22120 [Aspergillus glaucus CBS 516.65]